MTDLDFDELDKAVNELSNNTASIDGNKASVGDSSPVPNTTAPPTPSVPRPNTGQFMDVVHPSSDMKRGSLTAPQRPQINPTPINPDFNPAVPSAEPKVEATADQMPVLSGVEDQIDKGLADGNLGVSSDLPDSPFLADAKVEKRPLGAFSTPEEPKPQEAINAPMTDEQIPDDVQDDIQRVEADQEGVDDVQPIEPTETAESTPKVEEKVSLDQNISPEANVATSIVQQYKEKPTTGDQTTGPIYDTSSYHKALVKPAKKKSGWLMILWIVLLMIVGAGAGAAIYFWVLPLF